MGSFVILEGDPLHFFIFFTFHPREGELEIPKPYINWLLLDFRLPSLWGEQPWLPGLKWHFINRRPGVAARGEVWPGRNITTSSSKCISLGWSLEWCGCKIFFFLGGRSWWDVGDSLFILFIIFIFIIYYQRFLVIWLLHPDFFLQCIYGCFQK